MSQARPAFHASQMLIRSLQRNHGSKVVGEVTLDQVYGGARGIKSLVWEVWKSSIGLLEHPKSVLGICAGFRRRHSI